MDERLPQGAGEPLSVERHVAGHSNETFFVDRGDQRWVLRRPPRGAFLPTAHDVTREYRVLRALTSTPVRTPDAILLCEDLDVIGAPFFLMERVDGVVIRESLPWGWNEPARSAIGDELVDALVELHAIDPAAVGLEGFGRPSGYLARQVRRWSGQLSLTEPLTRPLPDLHRATRWLSENVPPDAAATIVHGDYKLDNVCFSHDARLLAILDWEMSTLGDPLADLGWMLSFWRETADADELVLDDMVPTRLPGFRSREELIARYERSSGHGVGDLTFYLVLATWKLAILLEGSYARHLAGHTDDPFFDRLGEAVPALGRRAVALTRGAG